MANPGVCPGLDRSDFSVTSYNVTSGAEAVNVSCRAFGHRVVGARSLVCDNGAWDPAVPSCEWTWDFTTHEAVVLGTAVGCAVFIILVAVITVIVCCCCRRRREEKAAYNDLMYGDNAGFVAAPGDTGGVYPDAYFAYQDVGDKNGNAPTMDRAWLGYIPRPKVAEGHYYH